MELISEEGPLSAGEELLHPLSIKVKESGRANSLADMRGDLFTRKTRSVREVIEEGLIGCRRLDRTEGTLTQEGCAVADITEQEVVIHSQQTGTFMLFVSSSYSVILESNYRAFSKLKGLSFENLKRNAGFAVSVSHFASFFLFWLVCALVDWSTLRRNATLILHLDLKKPPPTRAVPSAEA